MSILPSPLAPAPGHCRPSPTCPTCPTCLAWLSWSWRVRQPTRRRRPARGFTAIELLLTLAIIAILSALAAPSFSLSLERWRVRQAVEAMKSTLYLARTEAIKRAGGIGLQKNANNTDGCTLASTNAEWSCGWFVFVDTNNNGSWQKTEPVLHTVAAPTRVNAMHAPDGSSIRLDRYGMMGLNAQRFVFSPAPTGVASPATTTLCTSSGGRIRTISGEATCS